MKRTILVALLLLSLGFSRSQDGSAFSAKLDEHLNQAARQGFSGAALISRDGKIVFAKGYGLANRELDVPNTAQTRFRLGSITKQFTAVAILLLAERGKLGVQDSDLQVFRQLSTRVVDRHRPSSPESYRRHSEFYELAGLSSKDDDAGDGHEHDRSLQGQAA